MTAEMPNPPTTWEQPDEELDQLAGPDTDLLTDLTDDPDQPAGAEFRPGPEFPAGANLPSGTDFFWEDDEE